MWPETQPQLGIYDWNEIGEATLKRLDATERVAGFQRYILTFLLSTLGLLWLFSKSWLTLPGHARRFVNALSVGGTILTLSTILNPQFNIGFLLPLIWSAPLFLIKRALVPHDSVFRITAALGLSLLLFLLFQWMAPNTSPLIVQAFVVSTTYCLGLIILLKFWTAPLHVVLRTLALFSFLAWMPFLVSELKYFLLLQNINASTDFLSLIFLLSICGLTWILSRKVKWSIQKSLIVVSLNLIAGTILLGSYTPLGAAPTEMYEMANRVLPLMEWHFFRTVPLLKKVSSHFVSDYGFGLLYQIIYGYHGLDFLIFDVFEILLWGGILFLLLRRLLQSNLSALFCVMLLPFSSGAFSSYYLPGFIPLLLLLHLLKEKTTSAYWLFATVLVVMVPWRADLSVAWMPGILLLLGIAVWQKKLSTKKLIISLTTSGLLFAMLCWLICFWNDIDWMRNLKAIIDYLSSAQSYSLISMGDTENPHWALHHLIMPMLSALSLILALRLMLIEKSQPAFYRNAIIVFTAVFVLVNFPRGIVRHGFAEGSDNFLISLALLSFPLSALYSTSLKRFQRNTLYIIFLFIFSVWMRFPSRFKDESPFSVASIRPLNSKQIQYSASQHRLAPDLEFGKANTDTIARWLRSQLKEDETFFDFSNTPMLYYYAEKPVPSFFFQNPQNVHSMSLQADWIERMPEFKVPYVLYRHNPPNWWDATDGVPNETRHVMMALYLRRNYRFHSFVGGYEIWERR